MYNKKSSLTLTAKLILVTWPKYLFCHLGFLIILFIFVMALSNNIIFNTYHNLYKIQVNEQTG